MTYNPYAHSNHDVHWFANGVVLVRADHDAVRNVQLQMTYYDRGHGVILVERGSGRLLQIMADTDEQLDRLLYSVEGIW